MAELNGKIFNPFHTFEAMSASLTNWSEYCQEAYNALEEMVNACVVAEMSEKDKFKEKKVQYLEEAKEWKKV